MTTGTHIIAGVVVALYLKLPILPAVIGAVLPDIDISKGFPSKKTLFNAHRGITHHFFVSLTFLGMALLSKSFLPGFFYKDILSFSVGYLSHIFLDSFTPLGIPVGFSYRQRFSFRLLKSNKISEIIVVSVLIYLMFTLTRTANISFESFFGKENVSFLLNVLK